MLGGSGSLGDRIGRIATGGDCGTRSPNECARGDVAVDLLIAETQFGKHQISMLGRGYNPATLERWGLVNLVVADDALKAATMTLGAQRAGALHLALDAAQERVQADAPTWSASQQQPSGFGAGWFDDDLALHVRMK